MNDDSVNTGRKPDQIAYSVKDSPDGKGYWNRVGAMWKHKDGHGSEIILDSIPVNGHITLREKRDQRMQDYQDERNTRQAVNDGQNRNHGRER
ncbi:MAG: hypothetical protein H6937_02550 [Burkholderiales bacterium]|nr:hypothetical protein [Burkholderiales bacterium]